MFAKSMRLFLFQLEYAWIYLQNLTMNIDVSVYLFVAMEGNLVVIYQLSFCKVITYYI